MKPYQDVWADGRALVAGYRECAARYEVVKQFCAGLPERFTVCDIGANMCYFGLRLTEDFPGCTVMAFEFDHFQMRAEHVKRSDKTGRLLLLERKVTVADLRCLRSIHRFDVVLALSVIHHLPGDHAEWMAALRGLGTHVIAEFAGDDNPGRVGLRKGYAIPADAEIIGHGNSHLKKTQRPIVVMS
jgi:hypothetical protein